MSSVAPSEDSMSMSLASVPHGASSLPAAAVPTVLERFPGFVRCVMDIAPEVVGWVIGRSGAHIKEMKVCSEIINSITVSTLFTCKQHCPCFYRRLVLLMRTEHALSLSVNDAPVLSGKMNELCVTEAW